MASFTIATNTNWSTLTGRTGSDTYVINADATLTIDQDTRYGPNTTATTGPLGAVNCNAGKLVIDGRAVRLIPYDGGSGNVPAADTVISQSGVTGKLLGVWSALAATAPTSAGSAMPVTGWIKVRQVVGSYGAGALSGIAATATGADTAGWIEIILRETFGMSHVGGSLSSLEINGEWIELGTTSGTRNQTFQAPCSVADTYYNGVFIESAPGTGDFEPWPSAGSITAIATDERGRVVWVDSQGFIRIGHNGTADAGTLPPSGCRVVVPNVILSNTNATVGLGVNAAPTTTGSGRFTFSSSGTGQAITLEKCVVNGRNVSSGTPNTQGSKWVMFQDMAFFQASAPFVVDRCGVGSSGVAWTDRAASLSGYVDPTFIKCAFTTRASVVAVGVLTGWGNFGGYFEDCWFMLLQRPTNNTNVVYCNSSYNMTFIRPKFIGGQVSLPYNGYVKDMQFADAIVGTTGTGFAGGAIGLADGCEIDGISWVTQTPNACHPYGNMIAAANNVKIRNIGSPDNYLNMGTVNPANNVAGRVAGLLNSFAMDVRRVYVTGVRSVPFPGNISGGAIEDVGYRKGTVGAASALGGTLPNVSIRGVNLNGDTTVSLAANTLGNISLDAFTTPTTGKIFFPTAIPDAGAVSRALFAYGGGARVTGASYVQVPVVDAWVEWTTQSLRGHTGFQNVAQGPAANASIVFEYDIDKGSGFTGTYKVCNGANMRAEVGIDPLVGFRLKVRARGIAANTAQITTFIVHTTSTAALQASPLYPIQPVPISVSNVVPGSQVKVTRTDTGVVLFNTSVPGSTFSESVDYGELADVPIRIDLRKASSTPYYQPWVAQGAIGSNGFSVTALQIED